MWKHRCCLHTWPCQLKSTLRNCSTSSHIWVNTRRQKWCLIQAFLILTRTISNFKTGVTWSTHHNKATGKQLHKFVLLLMLTMLANILHKGQGRDLLLFWIVRRYIGTPIKSSQCIQARLEMTSWLWSKPRNMWKDFDTSFRCSEYWLMNLLMSMETISWCWKIKLCRNIRSRIITKALIINSFASATQLMSGVPHTSTLCWTWWI